MSVGIQTSNGFVKVAGIGLGATPMIGATETTDGRAGTVPQPTAEDSKKFLRGDGEWCEINIDDADSEEILNQSKEYVNEEIKKVTDTLPEEYAPVDAEKNTIVGLQVNGQELPISEERMANFSLTVGEDGNLYLTY